VPLYLSVGALGAAPCSIPSTLPCPVILADDTKAIGTRARPNRAEKRAFSRASNAKSHAAALPPSGRQSGVHAEVVVVMSGIDRRSIPRLAGWPGVGALQIGLHRYAAPQQAG